MQMVASGFFAGALIKDAFRAAFGDVQFRLVAAGEKSGRFQDDIDAEIFPRQRGRVLLLEDPNLVSAHDDVLVVVADFAVEFSVDRVPLQQMREGVGVGEIVDAFDALDIFLRHGAQDVAPDAAEAVDSIVGHKKALGWKLLFEPRLPEFARGFLTNCGLPTAQLRKSSRPKDLAVPSATESGGASKITRRPSIRAPRFSNKFAQFLRHDRSVGTAVQLQPDPAAGFEETRHVREKEIPFRRAPEKSALVIVEADHECRDHVEFAPEVRKRHKGIDPAEIMRFTPSICVISG